MEAKFDRVLNLPVLAKFILYFVKHFEQIKIRSHYEKLQNDGNKFNLYQEI